MKKKHESKFKLSSLVFLEVTKQANNFSISSSSKIYEVFYLHFGENYLFSIEYKLASMLEKAIPQISQLNLMFHICNIDIEVFKANSKRYSVTTIEGRKGKTYRKKKFK